VSAGDRVMAGTRFGGQAEQVVVKAADAIPLPSRCPSRRAAAIPVNYSTAWAALMTYGNLQPGERVLVHAAAGGVGGRRDRRSPSGGRARAGHRFAVQARRDPRQRGDEAYGYDCRRRWADRHRARRDRRRVVQALLRPAASGGRLSRSAPSSVVGGEKRNLVKAAPQALRMVRGFNLIEQMSASKAVIASTCSRSGTTAERWRVGDAVREMNGRRTLRPIVSDEVPFDRAADAHRIITERRNVGKVVLVP